MKKLDTKQAILDSVVTDLRGLIDAEGQWFYVWQSERCESLGYSRSSDERDRFSRIYDAAEYGADGSTHAEHLDDMEAYAEEYFDQLARAAYRLDLDDSESSALDERINQALVSVQNDIEQCRQWHQQNGSLEQQVG